MAFHVLQCIRQTLEASHPEVKASHPERTDGMEISLYYLADDVAHTMRGLDVVLSNADWKIFHDMAPKELAMALRVLAMLVPMRKYTKRRRNPRPPSTPRKSTKRQHHASTAKLLKKHDNDG